MGRSSLSGPVFGAQQLLFVAWKDAVATAQSDLEIFEIAVPSDQDWYITRVVVYCDAEGSDAATLDVEDDTTSILASAITLIADSSVASSITATAGEDSGRRVEAGSAITVDITTGTTTGPEDISVHVYGYPRYVGAPV